MKDPFDFTEAIRNKAFFRQWNLCAHCGKSLINIADEGHHVMPKQTGNLSNSNDEWIRSVDNCVMICIPCHIRVHENGNFRTGAAALPDFFPYSHGRQKLEHEIWVKKMKLLFQQK